MLTNLRYLLSVVHFCRCLRVEGQCHLGYSARVIVYAIVLCLDTHRECQGTEYNMQEIQVTIHCCLDDYDRIATYWIQSDGSVYVPGHKAANLMIAGYRTLCRMNHSKIIQSFYDF